MTRFREEVYDTAWGRHQDKVQRTGYSGDPGDLREDRLRCAERRSLRSEYFKKKAKGSRPKAQGRLDAW